jgi:uncharacterized protein (DUF4415 family)
MSGKSIRTFSATQVASASGQTDWTRLGSSGDFEGHDEDDIAVDWTKAELVVPRHKTAISVRLDTDVLDFFRAQGKGYQSRINAVLRAYMAAAVKRSG